MKVHTTSPFWFRNGALLDPAIHNQNTMYARDVVDDVSSKRYTHTPLTFSYVESCATGYTQALSAEKRSYRFTCPNTIELERAIFHYQGTGAGSGASVFINLIDVATGNAPTGISNPILSITTDASSATQTAAFVRPVTFTAGQQYRFEISASGNFTAEKADLTLHLRSDRYLPFGTDEYQEPTLVLLSEASTQDAATFLSTVTPITTAATNNFSATYTPALKPFAVVAHNFISSTSINLLRFDIPRAMDTERRSNIVRVFLAVVMSANGAGGQTVSLQIQNQAGTVLSTTSVSVSGTQAAQTSATVATDLATYTPPAIKTNTASDYRLVLATNGAVSVFRAHALVFIE